MLQVDAYIEALPDSQQTLMQHLRRLIVQAAPEVEEKFSFKIPFYHYFGMFCYLSTSGAGVSISFCRGKDLVEAFPQLEQKGRAAIASIALHSLKDMERLEVAQLIAAAAEWNKEAKLLKIPMVARKADRKKQQ